MYSDSTLIVLNCSPLYSHCKLKNILYTEVSRSNLILVTMMNSFIYISHKYNDEFTYLSHNHTIFNPFELTLQ